MEVFECVMQLLPHKRCCRISIGLAFSCGRVKTIRVPYVWTRIFFENGEKNLRFQKYPGACGQGLSRV